MDICHSQPYPSSTAIDELVRGNIAQTSGESERSCATVRVLENIVGKLVVCHEESM